MLECCESCGHGLHSEICHEITHKKKCPCEKFILQKFSSFDEVYKEHERLIFKIENDRKDPRDIELMTRRKLWDQKFCDDSKVRMLKQWIDDYPEKRK